MKHLLSLLLTLCSLAALGQNPVNTVADEKRVTYSPPQNIIPANGKVFTQPEIVQGIMFRWTSVLPKSREDIVYKCWVFDVDNEQSPAQAIKANKPVFEKEVNSKQTFWQMPVEITASKKENKFVWYVEAIGTADSAQGGNPKNYGKSKATEFKVVNEPPSREQITTGEIASSDGSFVHKITYSIGFVGSLPVGDWAKSNGDNERYYATYGLGGVIQIKFSRYAVKTWSGQVVLGKKGDEQIIVHLDSADGPVPKTKNTSPEVMQGIMFKSNQKQRTAKFEYTLSFGYSTFQTKTLIINAAKLKVEQLPVLIGVNYNFNNTFYMGAFAGATIKLTKGSYNGNINRNTTPVFSYGPRLGLNFKRINIESMFLANSASRFKAGDYFVAAKCNSFSFGVSYRF